MKCCMSEVCCMLLYKQLCLKEVGRVTDWHVHWWFMGHQQSYPIEGMSHQQSCPSGVCGSPTIVFIGGVGHQQSCSSGVWGLPTVVFIRGLWVTNRRVYRWFVGHQQSCSSGVCGSLTVVSIGGYCVINNYAQENNPTLNEEKMSLLIPYL